MGLDSTIGDLERLCSLNLTSCCNIWKLPDRICDLKSLEILILDGCSKLKELPDDLGKLECLREVHAAATALTFKELGDAIAMTRLLAYCWVCERSPT